MNMLSEWFHMLAFSEKKLPWYLTAFMYILLAGLVVWQWLGCIPRMVKYLFTKKENV